MEGIEVLPPTEVVNEGDDGFGGAFVATADLPPLRQLNLPFLWSSGPTMSSMRDTAQPYVKNMMMALGEDKVPRNLQSIIKQFDFTNNDHSSNFYLLLKKMETHCNVMSTDQAIEIKRLLNHNINRLLVKLRETNLPIFEGITAVLLGSAAEGTKTISPNEWDFVLFLPYFLKKQRENFSQQMHTVVLSTETLKEIASMLPDYDIDLQFAENLQNVVFKYLRMTTEGLELKGKCTNHSKALPVFYDYESLKIKLDISFGVRAENEEHTIDESLLRPLNEQPPHGFYILDEQVLLPTWTFREVRYMHSLSKNVKQCYQLTKCLTERCLLPCFRYDNCDCRRSLFPSYRLKLILFHLSRYYDEEKYWTPGQWCNRINEIFIIYSMCLRFGIITNLFSPLKQSYHEIYNKSIGEYFFFDDNLVMPYTLADKVRTVDDFGNVLYRSDFESRRFNGDIISLFSELLATLKQPDFNKDDEAASALSTYTEKFQKKQIGLTKDLELLQCITLEAAIYSILMPPDQNGAMLVALGNKNLIKYQYNEVIQQINLPGYPHDMCYYHNTITVLVQNKSHTTQMFEDSLNYKHGCMDSRLITLNFKDFSVISSLSLKQHGVCTSVTRLDDDFILAFNGKKQIIKIAQDGQIRCRSPAIFKYPSHMIAVKNTVTVHDNDLKSVTALKSNLESALFVYSLIPDVPNYYRTNFLYDQKRLCWNEVTGSIFVPSFSSVLEMSEIGEFRNCIYLRNLTNFTHMMFDKFSQSLIVGYFGFYKNVLHVYKF